MAVETAGINGIPRTCAQVVQRSRATDRSQAGNCRDKRVDEVACSYEHRRYRPRASNACRVCLGTKLRMHLNPQAIVPARDAEPDRTMMSAAMFAGCGRESFGACGRKPAYPRNSEDWRTGRRTRERAKILPSPPRLRRHRRDHQQRGARLPRAVRRRRAGRAYLVADPHPGQMEKVLAGIEAHPGPVLFTMVNEELRIALQDGCRRLQVPCIPVLDPVIGALASYLGMQSQRPAGPPARARRRIFRPHRRHELRARATTTASRATDYDEADVILVGVSRTSKTPTCIYLANRGIKAANVPIVPGCPLPPELLAARPPAHRRPDQGSGAARPDPPQPPATARRRPRTPTMSIRRWCGRRWLQARRLCAENGWPVIDVTRRSIEETAATIIQMLAHHRGGEAALE